MSTTKSLIPCFSKDKSYEMYKKEVSYWTFTTELAPAKQAMTLVLAIPDDSPIKEQVMENCAEDDLKKATGVKDCFLKFLETVYGKDDLCDTLEKYKDFRDFKKTDGMSMQEYITSFIQKHSKVAKKGLKFPNEILAFELIRNANISKDEEKLVLTGVDFDDKDNLFENAQKSLKKFMGGVCGKASDGFASSGDGVSDYYGMKTEPVFAAGNWRGKGRGKAKGVPSYTKNDFAQRTRQTGKSDYNPKGRQNPGQWKSNRPLNPLDEKGEPLKYHGCGSYRHFLHACPDKYESKCGSSNVFIADALGGYQDDRHDFVTLPNSNTLPARKGTMFSDFKDRRSEGIDRLTGKFENVVMFTGYNNDTLSELCNESQISGVVDTACMRTVCGQNWLKSYCDSLNDQDCEKVVFS